MTTNHCDLCNELSGGTENAFDRIYARNPKSRILFQSGEFVVIPSLGQIVEGHLLIVPNRHFAALGDMSDAFVGELGILCRNVRSILKAEYGSCIFFEHGTRCVDAGGCGVYHAHLHAVPFPAALEPLELLTLEFRYRELKDLSGIGEESEGSASYLFYQDSQDRSYVFRTGPLPSQYMRKLLVERLGGREWDWRAVGREERLLATLSRLSGRFENLGASAELTNGASR